METVEINSDEVKFLWNVQLKQKQKSLVFYREIEDSEEDSDVEYLFTRHFYEETEPKPILEEETPESEEEVVEPSVAEPEEKMIIEPISEEKIVTEPEPSVIESVEIPESEPRRSNRKRKQTDFLVAQKQIKFFY